ncbi:MAG: ABC transporter ATP-binding protein [Micrococcales bacterium]
MIKLTNLSFTHALAESPTLKALNLEYQTGEFALICGPTGSGKSTLLQVINGLAPHFTAGSVSGKLQINNRDFTNLLPHEIAPYIGYVSQQAESSFVADRVDEELAFGMEQLGVASATIETKIRKAAQALDLEHVLESNLTELSGGQQQRVAIAASLAAGQKILLLDEPTSELDPKAAHELLVRLKDLSVRFKYTILIAEHRIERALDLVDSVTVVNGDGTASKAETGNLDPLLQNYRMVPPLVELGQALKLKPLPLNVEEAKKHNFKFKTKMKPKQQPAEFMIELNNLTVKYENILAVDDANLTLAENQILGLMGENGSGKSSLLWAIRDQNTEATLMPQTASDLLMFNSVREELEDSDREAGVESGTTAKMLTKLSQRLDPHRHPRDLSAGQQLSLVLAIQLVNQSRLLLLDEPTRGLDYQAKKQLAEQLKNLKSGKAILLASHDVEFLALVADEIVEIRKGKVSQPKSLEQALGSLGELAPQVWQVTETAMTVDDAVSRINR